MKLEMKDGRLLGRILLDAGLLSDETLELALAEQQHTNELLGQILVRMGVVKEAEIKAVLAVQGHIGSLQEAVRSAAGERQMLGSLLVRSGHITNDQLEHAIVVQKASGEKLGEVLIRQGLLHEAQLNSLLAYQHNQSEGKRQSNPFRLGEILVMTGYISRQQLDQAIVKQAGCSKRLGEVLIEEGYAESRHIIHGIHLQQKLITAALVAILSFSGLSMSGCGGGGGGGSEGTAAKTQEVSAYDATSAADVRQSFKTNYLTVASADLAIAQPTFYYSTVNESFWSIQANVANAVIDIDSESVIRIDIQKSADGFPRLNKTFSIGTDAQYEQFPGNFLVFNLKKSTGNKVESGIVSFSPGSITEKYVSGSYNVLMTDYDCGTVPAPQYRIKGIFSFTMGEYGPA